jgi:hypothetical protein
VDLGVNDSAYAVWQQSGDVRAARLQDATWTPLAAPADINPADTAGTGALRPRVAVSAEGYAVVTWGEITDRQRVYARRLTGLNLSQFPQQVSQDADGGNADSPDIDIEDDGSFAWVVYRQDAGGVSRSFARRLVGSQFEPMSPIDGGVGTTEPRIDMNGRGAGEAVAQTFDNGVMGSLLDRDVFETAYLLGTSPTPSKPEVAGTDRGNLAIAWRSGADAVGLFKPYRKPFAGRRHALQPAYGPVNDPGVFIGGDRVGDFAVAMVQGAEGAKALTWPVYDDPPTAPYIGTAEAYKRKTRPSSSGGRAPTCGARRRSACSWTACRSGRRGRRASCRRRRSRPAPQVVRRGGRPARPDGAQPRAHDEADATAPTLRVRVDGKRSRGSTLKIRVTVKDSGGSGLDHTTIDSATIRRRPARAR